MIKLFTPDSPPRPTTPPATTTVPSVARKLLDLQMGIVFKIDRVLEDIVELGHRTVLAILVDGGRVTRCQDRTYLLYHGQILDTSDTARIGALLAEREFDFSVPDMFPPVWHYAQAELAEIALDVRDILPSADRASVGSESDPVALIERVYRELGPDGFPLAPEADSSDCGEALRYAATCADDGENLTPGGV